MVAESDPRFRGGQADDYDARIRQRVPGYATLHLLTAAQLLARLPDTAHLLVVGAGTGREILELAERRPDWTFTASDLSADMLAVAEEHLDAAGVGARVRTHVGPLDSLPEGPGHDAALLLLVAHFVPDDGARQDLYSAIAARLRPGGLLLTGELVDTGEALADELYRTSGVLHGLSDEAAADAVVRVSRDFHPVTPERTEELLATSGFGPPRRYFQTLGFLAHITTLESSETPT